MKNRKIEIDFLRGIAILLVILFHDRTLPFVGRMGWMGVDLFFVLSGYLVSGLLFKEYSRYQKVNAKMFLIRRGFKIYPVFYIFLAISVALLVLAPNAAATESGAPATGGFEMKKLIFEALFLRNYGPGMWAHTWSLCVEEHFYFFLAFVMYLFARAKQLENRKLVNGFFILILIVCLINRIAFVSLIPLYKKSAWLVHIQTQFRIDSLSFGVLIAYNRYFNPEGYMRFYNRYKGWLLSAALVIMMPAMIMAPEDPAKMGDNFFLRSFGYITLYVGFGLILIYFITNEKTVHYLTRGIGKPMVSLISFIGLYSYSIYVFHTMIRKYIVLNIHVNPYVQTIIFVTLAVLVGVVVGRTIETYFLKLRDKYFPSRAA